MISTTPAPTELDNWTDNILDVWDSATVEQREKGRQWYPVAHDVAEMMFGDVQVGAGVIAALSANKRWNENIKLAEQCAAGNVRGHVQNALTKVRRILAGQYPADVLPDSKTGHFYQCIANPDHPTAVVIDRHAHDVAVGKVCGNDERGLSTKSRYDALADCYRSAASVLGELPSVVQATVWVVWTQSLAGVGKRGFQHAEAR